MRKQNRSCGASAAAKQKFNFGARLHQKYQNNKSHRAITSGNLDNKRGYSAEGYSLLTSALRPRLFGSEKSNFSGIRKLDIAIFGIISAISFVGFGLINNNDASATVQATLTIPDNISVNVNPYENNGFAEGSVGQVDVSTSNQAGYTLSIKAKDGTELRNGDNTLQSITTNLTTEQYQNGEYYNTWGFKPDVVNSLANSNYIPSPSTSGIVLAKSNTNSLSPETFNLAIATKVNQDAVAGNYTNSFVLTATGNEARYNIKFDNNGGTGGPQAPQTDLIGDNLEVQIESETPSMEGKDFLGWCTKKPKEDGSCTGVIVQPAGCFPLCKCDLDITLYAMYGEKSSGESGTDLEGGPCSRPGYTGEAKYYDGKCWMWKDVPKNWNWQQAQTACPSGWHLPSKTEYDNLAVALGGSLGRLRYEGWNGYYWTSTLDSDQGPDTAYIFNALNYFNMSYASLSNTYLVRCVSDQ